MGCGNCRACIRRLGARDLRPLGPPAAVKGGQGDRVCLHCNLCPVQTTCSKRHPPPTTAPTADAFRAGRMQALRTPATRAPFTGCKVWGHPGLYRQYECRIGRWIALAAWVASSQALHLAPVYARPARRCRPAQSQSQSSAGVYTCWCVCARIAGKPRMADWQAVLWRSRAPHQPAACACSLALLQACHHCRGGGRSTGKGAGAPLPSGPRLRPSPPGRGLQACDRRH